MLRRMFAGGRPPLRDPAVAAGCTSAAIRTRSGDIGRLAGELTVSWPPRLTQTASGLIHRRPPKRAKSESTETTGSPCSMARAASCASVTRLPRRSRPDELPENERVRSPPPGSSRSVLLASARRSTRRQPNSAVARTPADGLRSARMRRSSARAARFVAGRSNAERTQSGSGHGAESFVHRIAAGRSRQEARAPLSDRSVSSSSSSTSATFVRSTSAPRSRVGCW